MPTTAKRSSSIRRTPTISTAARRPTKPRRNSIAPWPTTIEAIKVNPNSAYAYNSRGAAYQRKGDFARAAADYGAVTRLQPNNIDAWSARCWVRAVSPGQTQQALSDCNQALKIKPDAADVLDTRGFIYLKLGQTDNAIKDYDAALKLDPRLAGSLYGRGVAKFRKGDRSSITDIAAAKAIKSDIAEEFSRYGLRPQHETIQR